MSAQSPIDRFDGATHWAALSPEQQAEIGVIALELAASCHAQERTADREAGDRIVRAVATAEMVLIGELLEVTADALPDIFGVDRPPLIQGCGWAEPDLCTACVETEACDA